MVIPASLTTKPEGTVTVLSGTSVMTLQYGSQGSNPDGQVVGLPRLNNLTSELGRCGRSTTFWVFFSEKHPPQVPAVQKR
jgi:hypothetical protein